MLETMREYGQERLAAAGEVAYTRKSHAAYCLVLAEEAAPTVRRERIGKHRLDAELGNFRAALDWLTSAGEVEWGLRLMMAIALFFISRRLHSEGINRLSRLLALPAVERFPRLRNWARYWQTDLAFEGREATLRDRYLEYWKLFEDASDREGMMQVASRLGLDLKDRDLAEARLWGERAVELGRTGFPPIMLAGLLSNLADVVRQEEFTRARALYQEAMRLFEESGDRENAIWALSHEADLHREHGFDAQARSLYLEALQKFRALGFSLGTASCLYDLAGLDAAEGELAKAEGMYSECLRLYGAENVAELPRVLESLAFVKIRGAEPERALTLAGAATAIRERFWVQAVIARRAELEQKVEAVRKELGAEATVHWMKGWNMSPKEIVDWATEEG
jgi:tetratricopeptide (TPR) repeat protein